MKTKGNQFFYIAPALPYQISPTQKKMLNRSRTSGQGPMLMFTSNMRMHIMYDLNGLDRAL